MLLEPEMLRQRKGKCAGDCPWTDFALGRRQTGLTARGVGEAP
jgi:hypothetical protein